MKINEKQKAIYVFLGQNDELIITKNTLEDGLIGQFTKPEHLTMYLLREYNINRHCLIGNIETGIWNRKKVKQLNLNLITNLFE